MKLLLVLGTLMLLGQCQSATLPPVLINPKPLPVSQNPYLNPYAYPSDCCPFRYTKEFASEDPKNFQHLLETNKYFNPYLPCLCTHWVIALDKSGSMNGRLWSGPPYPISTYWDAAKDILDYIYVWLTPRPFHYSSFYTFDGVAQLPYYLHQAPVLDQATDALGGLTPSGGTNFNNALLRAIDIIQLYLFENTCFIMISDGFASPPLGTTVSTFIGTLRRIRANGCYVCSICIFIKREGYNTIYYNNYREYCLKLELTWVESEPKEYTRTIASALQKDRRQFMTKEELLRESESQQKYEIPQKIRQ